MADRGYDDEGRPGRRDKGFPFLGVALGCGLALLLLIGSCLGLGVWGAKKVKSAADDEWRRLPELVEQLRSDAGAREIYASSPGLAAAYPTEETFVAAAGAWRLRLGDVPAEPPSLLSGRYALNVQHTNERRRSSLAYRFENDVWIRADWEDGLLVHLVVD